MKAAYDLGIIRIPALSSVTLIAKPCIMEKMTLLPSINTKRTEVYFVPLAVFLEQMTQAILITEELVKFMIPFAPIAYYGRQGDEVLKLFGLTRWENDRCREVCVNLPAEHDFKLAAA